MYKIITNSLLSISLLISCGNVPKETKMNSSLQLISKNATPETVKLYQFMAQTAVDHKIMLGHQDALAYGPTWFGDAGRSDVKDIVGDYPAVIGLELGNIELGLDRNLDSVSFADMKRYIKETHARGGISTCSWHGSNIVTGKNAWDCGQDIVVKSVLPEGTHHKEFLTWLDKVSAFFADLVDEHGNPIPIVFRPYHENTGNWFWWCADQCTAEEYKQLWKMTIDYMLNEKSLKNLIFAYTPSTLNDESHFLDRYPGDDYVDVIGFDTYVLDDKSIDVIDTYKKDLQRSLKSTTRYAKAHNKVAIIGETGMEGIPYNTYFTEVVYPIINQYDIAWVLFWRNAWETDKPNHHYLPYKGHSSVPDFKLFVEKPEILLNKDISVK